MDIVEKMAADIALTMNGGEWKDGKWYSKGHREAWIKAVQPYADEIERLRGAIIANQSVALDALATHGQLCDEIERLRDVLQMWVKFWNEDGDDVWMAEEAMMATNQILGKDK